MATWASLHEVIRWLVWLRRARAYDAYIYKTPASLEHHSCATWPWDHIHTTMASTDHSIHVVLLPFPVQGHINPLLQFGKRLTRFNGVRCTLGRNASYTTTCTGRPCPTPARGARPASGTRPTGAARSRGLPSLLARPGRRRRSRRRRRRRGPSSGMAW
jgi:hypothetical protein